MTIKSVIVIIVIIFTYPSPGLGQPIQRSTLKFPWHQNSLGSTLCSVISLLSHPSLGFFTCQMGPISFAWTSIMGTQPGHLWKSARYRTRPIKCLTSACPLSLLIKMKFDGRAEQIHNTASSI